MRSLIMEAAMARTLVSPANLNLSHRNISKLLQNQIPPFSAVHFRSTFQKNNLRFVSNSRINCSFDYGGSSHVNGGNDTKSYDGFSVQQYPKPTEIQWKKELCNSVQLIGIVATPVQIKHLSSGKALAWSRLAVKKSPTETAWINLTFWDELAHVASQHLEKGHQIYVSGRLASDTVESDDGKQQTYYKVVVQQMNYIERNAAAVGLNNADSNSGGRNQPQYGAATTNSGSTNSGSTTEELWQAFFANPLEWWDNRKNKRSPNYPDFKHKDTGEALWIEGRYNPPWVKSQLSILDTRMQSFHDQSSSNSSFGSMIGDSFPIR